MTAISSPSPLGRGKVMSRVAIALAIAGVGLSCQDPLREYEKRYAAERKAQREASMKHRSESRVRLQAMLKERGVRDSVRRTTERMRPDPACWRAVVAVASRCYQFTVEDAGYTVEIEPDGPRGTDFVKRIRVHDDSALIVYDESFIAPGKPASSMRMGAGVIEDAGGRPRAFLFGYNPASSRSYSRIFVPREGRLEALTPPFNYGNVGSMPDGSQDGMRLLEGDRFVISQWRSGFDTYALYRIDFNCEPGGPRCVRPAPDSVAGLARFAVDPISQIGDAHWEPTEETVTIEMFDRPRAAKSELVTIPPGTTIQVLGGAGRLLDSEASDSTNNALMKDDWLHIGVKGRNGWIHRASFVAIESIRREPGPKVPYPLPPLP